MDLVFNSLPDVFSYQSLRHASYDAPWLSDANTNKGRRAPERPRAAPVRGGGRDTCDSCPLCQEKQRRPLATYIRSKSRQDKREDASIQEEEEEEEEEAAEIAERPTATAPATTPATTADGARA